MTDTSPYDFGLHEEYFIVIPPLLYFLSKTLEGILFPPQPFTPLLASNSDLPRPASLKTCSPTEPEETSIYNDHRRTVDAWHAVIACLFVVLLCFALRYSEDKWNRSSLKGRWSYRVDWWKEVFYPPEKLASPPIMVPSHNDYRLTQRREAIRLLFKVMISPFLCPIAEYLFCAREGVSERLHNNLQGNTGGEAHGALVNGLFMVYLVFRYGTLPWLVTAVASGCIICNMFPPFFDVESAPSVWDRWIERWISAHQMENAVAEARYMAEMKDLEPGDPHMFSRLPELNPDVYWRTQEQVLRDLGYIQVPSLRT